MTDKELLELAAKAIGFKYMNSALWDGRDVVEYSWNPLEDDCHALRLAVKLKLCFGPNFEGDLAVCFGDNGNNMTEPFGNNPYAATRRAIVRAAAEIGKGTNENK